MVNKSLIACLIGSFLCCSYSKAESEEKPPNLVIEPPYSVEAKTGEPDASESSQLIKRQYQPTYFEAPLLQEKEGNDDVVSGSEYKSGPELFVCPKPDFQVKDEDIQEKSDQEPERD